MRRPTRLLSFVLACASSVIVARAQSPAALPKPGPEVKELVFMVGKFTNEGAVKAGAMGPNSPAMKVSGTDECRWAAGGFGLTCTYAYDVGGTKWAGTGLFYYDSTPKKYRYHAINNLGEIEDQTGTVSGDTWTWNGERLNSANSRGSPPAPMPDGAAIFVEKSRWTGQLPRQR